MFRNIGGSPWNFLLGIPGTTALFGLVQEAIGLTQGYANARDSSPLCQVVCPFPDFSLFASYTGDCTYLIWLWGKKKGFGCKYYMYRLTRCLFAMFDLVWSTLSRFWILHSKLIHLQIKLVLLWIKFTLLEAEKWSNTLYHFYHRILKR